MNNRNRVIAIVAAVIAVVLIVGIGLWIARPKEEPSAGTSPSPSPSQTDTSPSTEPASPDPASPSASGMECTTATAGFVPVRYTIEGSMDVDETVISVGVDESGNIGAPPPAEKRTAAWWEDGPAPGSDAGKVVLSIHTYRNGGALGNEMYEGGQSQLKDGDIIKMYSESGEVACYKFNEAKKVFVDEYDPDSDVMIDFEGDPKVAIIICWDFDATVDESAGQDPWKSRVFFYGTMF